MENINQLLYLILTIFISSMFFNAVLQLKHLKKHHQSNVYWILALSLLIVWSTSFTIAPNTSYFFITVANTSNLGATICVALLLRSTTHKITKKLEITLLVLLLIYGIVFEYLRIEDNYTLRGYMILVALACTNVWQLKETWSLNQKNKSIQLKFIFSIIFIQILIMCYRASIPPSEVGESVRNIYTETGQIIIIRMTWSSAFLLLFSFISNYFYEQLLISERKTVNQLEQKKVKLLAKTQENQEIKLLLEERASLINSLILANKTAATGALSASIAHELNQPITAIQLNADHLKLAIDDNYKNHSNLKEIIDDIQYDNQRSARIIRTLKDIFQEQQIETQPTNINQVIENIIPIVQPKIRINNIQLDLILQATSIIKLNKSEFQQVILNLVNNAIDALNILQKKDKKITIRTREIGDYLEFSVIDNGIGVPKEMEASLFQLMKTNKQSGMGLGLWLTKHIIDRHNGQISYQNTEAHGVEFLIRLPLSLSREPMI